MILKRIILPVIAVIVILASMIVPASAACENIYDPTCSQFYSATNARLDISTELDDGTDYRVLSVEVPDRFNAGYQNWQSSVGELDFSWSVSRSTSYDYYNLLFSLPSNRLISHYEYSFDELYIRYNDADLIKFLGFSLTSKDSFTVSFDVTFVNEERKPETTHFNYVGSSWSNPDMLSVFLFTDVYDNLATKNIEPDSCIIISNFCFSCTPSGRSNVYFQSYYAFSQDMILTSEDFLYDNHLRYEETIYESFNLFNLTHFLSDGIAGFMDTPIFGEISLGMIFNAILAAMLMLILIKMFT